MQNSPTACEKKVLTLECLDAEKRWSGERLEQRDGQPLLSEYKKKTLAFILEQLILKIKSHELNGSQKNKALVGRLLCPCEGLTLQQIWAKS